MKWQRINESTESRLRPDHIQSEIGELLDNPAGAQVKQRKTNYIESLGMACEDRGAAQLTWATLESRAKLEEARQGSIMTDMQILTIAIAIIIPISSLIYSNSRISDVRDSLGKRIDAVDRRIDELRAEINRRFDNQQGLLETIMGKLDELDRRTLRP